MEFYRKRLKHLFGLQTRFLKDTATCLRGRFFPAYYRMITVLWNKKIIRGSDERGRKEIAWPAKTETFIFISKTSTIEWTVCSKIYKGLSLQRIVASVDGWMIILLPILNALKSFLKAFPLFCSNANCSFEFLSIWELFSWKPLKASITRSWLVLGFYLIKWTLIRC